MGTLLKWMFTNEKLFSTELGWKRDFQNVTDCMFFEEVSLQFLKPFVECRFRSLPSTSDSLPECLCCPQKIRWGNKVQQGWLKMPNKNFFFGRDIIHEWIKRGLAYIFLYRVLASIFLISYIFHTRGKKILKLMQNEVVNEQK